MSKNLIDRSLSSLLEEETLEVDESSMDHVSSWKDYPTCKFRFVSLLLVGLGLKGIIDGTADTMVKGTADTMVKGTTDTTYSGERIFE